MTTGFLFFITIQALQQTGKGTHGVVVSPDNKYTYATNMY